MFESILVTLDGTARSEAVMPYALETARRFGSKITLLRVVDQPRRDESGVMQAPRARRSAEEMILDSLIEQAQSYLVTIGRQLHDGGLAAHEDVRVGRPGEQIVKAATEHRADVIAMATRSRQGLSRLVFGSVAEYVLRESHLPVLLITAA